MNRRRELEKLDPAATDPLSFGNSSNDEIGERLRARKERYREAIATLDRSLATINGMLKHLDAPEEENPCR